MSPYLIQYFRLQNDDDQFAFDNLTASSPNLVVIDKIWDQLIDLIKILNTDQQFNEVEIDHAIKEHLQDTPLEEYGVWIFYPWRNSIVHLLDIEEFLTVKTNRNKDKITNDQQSLLRTKHVGIIGLSVGNSAATTIAMEGCAGSITLADFDTLELSNCNRIKTSILNLGLPKVVITAREILEIDPFIQINCFMEGISSENIDQFIVENGRIDLIVEECDNVAIKILAREKARQYCIPLVMEMSDRGMIDIERYDIDNDYEMFHGGIAGYDLQKMDLTEIDAQQKMKLMYHMVGGDSISLGLKDSLPKIGKTLLTYPQLASAVMLGGGVCTDVVRRILLNQIRLSGRFYVDLEQIIS